jgi:hypothetical protein
MQSLLIASQAHKVHLFTNSLFLAQRCSQEIDGLMMGILPSSHPSILNTHSHTDTRRSTHTYTRITRMRTHALGSRLPPVFVDAAPCARTLAFPLLHLVSPSFSSCTIQPQVDTARPFSPCCLLSTQARQGRGPSLLLGAPFPPPCFPGDLIPSAFTRTAYMLTGA